MPGSCTSRDGAPQAFLHVSTRFARVPHSRRLAPWHDGFINSTFVATSRGLRCRGASNSDAPESRRSISTRPFPATSLHGGAPTLQRRACSESTQVWWLRYRPHFAVFISDLVVAECSDGGQDAARERLAALETHRYRVPFRPLGDSIRKLVRRRVDSREGSRRCGTHRVRRDDSVRFLLTWNCKHLANRMILRRVAQRCEAQGFHCPQICTRNHDETLRV